PPRPRPRLASSASRFSGLTCPAPRRATPPHFLRPGMRRTLPTAREEAPEGASSEKKSGGDLLSQGASPQVPSALAGLTSVFGMGTGVTPPLWPPEIVTSGCQ